jgi:hypothetical protein
MIPVLAVRGKNTSAATASEFLALTKTQSHEILNLAGGESIRAAPEFASSTIETRGVPNFFCGLCRKGSGFDVRLAQASVLRLMQS